MTSRQGSQFSLARQQDLKRRFLARVVPDLFAPPSAKTSVGTGKTRHQESTFHALQDCLEDNPRIQHLG